MDIDAILSKTNAKLGGTDSSHSPGSTGSNTAEQHNKSYKSLGSNGSAGSKRDERKVVAGAVMKRPSLEDVENGASAKSLKDTVSRMIVAKRLSDITAGSSTADDGPASADDPDIVAPPVVLELWAMVADGAVDGSGEYIIHVDST